MRSESNIKAYYLISVGAHLIFFITLNYAPRLGNQKPETQMYEFIPVSEFSSHPLQAKLKPMAKPLLKDSITREEQPKAKLENQQKNNEPPVKSDTLSTLDNILPKVIANALLTSGVQIVNIDDVTRSVKRTSYAVTQNIEGSIKLKLLIDEKGQLRQMTALNTLGYGLDEVAQSAAKKLIFLPARTASGPVAVEIYYTIKFSILHQ